MTQHILLAVFLCLFANLSAQISISNNGGAPDESAMMDVESTSKGILIPRMKTSQREAIVDPATGLMVYDIENNRIWQYNDGWKAMQNEDDYQEFQVFNDTIMLTGSESIFPIGDYLDAQGFDQSSTNEIQQLGWVRDSLIYLTLSDSLNLGEQFRTLGWDLSQTNEVQQLGWVRDSLIYLTLSDSLNLGEQFRTLGWDLSTDNELQQLSWINDTLIFLQAGGTLNPGAQFRAAGWDLSMDNEIQTLNWVEDSLLCLTNSGTSPIRKSELNYMSVFNDTILWRDGPMRLAMNDNVAIEFDQGRSQLNNSFNMLETRRSWVNFILDTDQNQSDAHFALYRDVPGTPAEAAVSFSVDPGGDSWINTGDFGIGTNNPFSDMHVRHKGNESQDGLILENGAITKAFRLFVNSNGNLMLYSTESEGTGPVGGFNGSTGQYLALSDMRFKENIDELTASSDIVRALRPVRYNFTSDSNKATHLGFLAQEVADVLPEAVTYDAEIDQYMLDYSAFGVLAISALQEQEQTITTLRDKTQELDAKVKELERQLDELSSLSANLEEFMASKASEAGDAWISEK